ncbi:unnamed protein product [Lactuca saligna]|uniref:Uncharacterized protein n=1 Tax=Lactuca saligna TaxID=75948 RepID=A0AA35ZZM8_LACSI|nr:unnamed protein product [Lactuca saligna]
MFPLARGNAALRRNNLYPRMLRWFHLRRLAWENVCNLFDVDQDEAHQPKRKMIASEVESSTPHYLTYITSLNPEGASSSDPSCGNSRSTQSTGETHTVGINRRTAREIMARLQTHTVGINRRTAREIMARLQTHTVGINRRTAREIMARLQSLEEEIRGIKYVGGSYWMTSLVNEQFGSPPNSNRVNEDNDVGRRKQKQHVKEKKKKKIVANNIVDAENHIPMPPVAKPRCPVRVLKRDDNNEFFDATFRGNEDVGGSYRMTNPVNKQFGSPSNSNRVNKDDDVGCRKQKQPVKEKKKKKIVANIVDAENHILVPPVAKLGRPVRVLKPSQYLCSPYVSYLRVRYLTIGLLFDII